MNSANISANQDTEYVRLSAKFRKLQELEKKLSEESGTPAPATPRSQPSQPAASIPSSLPSQIHSEIKLGTPGPTGIIKSVAKPLLFEDAITNHRQPVTLASSANHDDFIIKSNLLAQKLSKSQFTSADEDELLKLNADRSPKPAPMIEETTQNLLPPDAGARSASGAEHPEHTTADSASHNPASRQSPIPEDLASGSGTGSSPASTISANLAKPASDAQRYTGSAMSESRDSNADDHFNKLGANAILARIQQRMSGTNKGGANRTAKASAKKESRSPSARVSHAHTGKSLPARTSPKNQIPADVLRSVAQNLRETPQVEQRERTLAVQEQILREFEHEVEHDQKSTASEKLLLDIERKKIQADLANEKIYVEQLEAQARARLQIILEKEQEISARESQVKSGQEQINSLLAGIEATKKQLASREQALAQTQAAAIKTDQELALERQEVVRLREFLHAEEKNHARVRKQLADKEEALAAREQRVFELEQSSELAGQDARLEKEAAESLKKSLAVKQKELFALQTELKHKLHLLSVTQDDLAIAKRDAVGIRSELGSLLEQAKERLAIEQRAHNELKNAVSKERKKIQDRERAVEQRAADIEKAIFEIATARETIANERSIIARQQADYDRFNKEVSDEALRLEKLRNELDARDEALVMERKKLLGSMVSERKLHEDMRKEAAARLAAAEELEGKLAQRSAALEQREAKLRSVALDLETARKELGIERRNLTKASEQFGKRQTELDTLARSLSEREASCATVIAAIDKKQKELESSHKIFEREQRELSREFEKKEKQLTLWHNKLVERETQAKELLESLEPRDEQLKALSLVLATRKKELDDYAVQIGEQEKPLKSQLASMAKERKALEQLQENIRHRGVELDQQVREIESARKEVERKARDLARVESKLTEQTHDHDERVRALAEQITRADAHEKQIDAAQKVIARKADELDAFAQKLREQKEQLSALESRINAQSKLVDKEGAILAKREKELVQKQRELSQREEATLALEAALQKTQAKHAALVVETKQLVEGQKELLAARKSIEHDVSVLSARRKDEEAALRSIEKERAKIEDKIREIAALARKERELEARIDEFGKAQKKFSLDQIKLGEREAAYYEREKKLVVQEKALERALAERDTSRRDLLRKIDALAKKEERMVSQLLEAQHAVDKLTDENKMLQQAIKSAAAEYQNSVRENSRREKEQAEQMRALESKQKDLQESLAQTQRAREELRAENAALYQSVKTLQGQQHLSAKEISKRDRDLMDTIKTLQVREKDLISKLTESQRIGEQLHAENETLEQSLKSLSSSHGTAAKDAIRREKELLLHVAALEKERSQFAVRMQGSDAVREQLRAEKSLLEQSAKTLALEQQRAAKEMSKREAELNSKLSALNTVQAQFAAREAALNNKERMLASQISESTAAEQRLASLKDEITAIRADNLGLKKELDKKARLLANAKLLLENQTTIVLKKEAELLEKEAQLADREAALSGRESRLSRHI